MPYQQIAEYYHHYGGIVRITYKILGKNEKSPVANASGLFSFSETVGFGLMVVVRTLGLMVNGLRLELSYSATQF